AQVESFSVDSIGQDIRHHSPGQPPRQLKQRHVQISLCPLCEMTSFAPIAGSFPYYAARWMDPALGFALFFRSDGITFIVMRKLFFTLKGMYLLIVLRVTVPVELTGIQILAQYYYPSYSYVRLSAFPPPRNSSSRGLAECCKLFHTI
ncbi:hypothetical protein ID866_4921, partial [Astraeus odoratus]